MNREIDSLLDEILAEVRQYEQQQQQQQEPEQQGKMFYFYQDQLTRLVLGLCRAPIPFKLSINSQTFTDKFIDTCKQSNSDITLTTATWRIQ